MSTSTAVSATSGPQRAVSTVALPENAWELAADAAAPEIERLRLSIAPAPPLRVLRVSQLDAGRLDAELSELLREQFTRVFSPSGTAAHLKSSPETLLFVELLIFVLSVGRGRATPGASLLNLRYRDQRAKGDGGRTGIEGPGLSLPQRIALGFLTVGGRYFWSRLGTFAVNEGWSVQSTTRQGWTNWQVMRAIWQVMRAMEGWHKAASLANFLLFLKNGWYRSLAERLVRARLVYEQPTMNRAISFDYMNRELVWHELSELLLFLLPLISAAKVQQWVAKLGASLLPQSAVTLGSRLVGGGVAGGHGDSTPRSQSNLCPICSTTPRVPFVASPCRHVYCYYCLRAHCMGDPEFKCQTEGCGVRITAMARQCSASI
eukprot:CAMPEP_0198233678 /NCGR_PEP_ID=MMETSP1445-20131203/116364_1 /TAXON_ID=36898 /ORGANISM="Pyramimonas sp., Strain CCMP2087" /LENGTH=375 /DNA_ID=CAMNT_0043914379 /DNA_START=112 /DNA_END=1239 /DNA_ORIENTATION=-